MAVKPDSWIKEMAIKHRMIEPFADRQVREGVISYGVSSYGYDMRVADEFRILKNPTGATIDPKQFDDQAFETVKRSPKQAHRCLRPPKLLVYLPARLTFSSAECT